MTEKQFQRIYKKTYEINGVLIVSLPLEKSGYAISDGSDNFIFVNSRLPARRKKKLVRLQMKKFSS